MQASQNLCAFAHRWHQVHEVEEQAFPEFFVRGGQGRSCAPNLYKQYRDTIIDLYRANPRRRLRATDVRRHVVGDFNTLTA